MADDNLPNILFIMTDQQRGDCLGVENHPVLQTPSMDSIAHNGVRFGKFYCPSPSCIAARRSLMTGQDPQTHGLVGYQDGLDWDHPPTLPECLQQAGYQTKLVGRAMHLSPPEKRYGFEHSETNDPDYADWLAEYGPRDNGGWFGGGIMHNDWTAKPWGMEEHLHFTNWTVNRAIKFLQHRDPTAPYFLTVSFIAPHPPLQPPQFYMDRYLRTGVPEPVYGDWATAPEIRGDTVAPDSVHLEGEAMLSARAAYYGLINHVDDQIRRILNRVDGYGRYNHGRDTIIVFTSDHGEMLGDHYMWRKSRAFESSARVPFLIQAPPRFGVEAGTKTNVLGSLTDVMPTLLDMAGLEIPDTVDGKSLLAAMRGDSSPVREILHIEHSPYHHALTDGRWKYIWDVGSGEELFFDLNTDPDELKDLSQDSDISHWRNTLIERLSDRPEGFVENDKLKSGVDYRALIPR